MALHVTKGLEPRPSAEGVQRSTTREPNALDRREGEREREKKNKGKGRDGGSRKQERKRTQRFTCGLVAGLPKPAAKSCAKNRWPHAMRACDDAMHAIQPTKTGSHMLPPPPNHKHPKRTTPTSKMASSALEMVSKARMDQLRRHVICLPQKSLTLEPNRGDCVLACLSCKVPDRLLNSFPWK